MKVHINSHWSGYCLSLKNAWSAPKVFRDKPAGFIIETVSKPLGNVSHGNGSVLIHDHIQNDSSLDMSPSSVIRIVRFRRRYWARWGRCSTSTDADNFIAWVGAISGTRWSVSVTYSSVITVANSGIPAAPAGWRSNHTVGIA